MKLNLSLIDWKIKVWIWLKEDMAHQVTMTQEVVNKLVVCCITGKRPEWDVRDFTEEMWKEFDLGKKIDSM